MKRINVIGTTGSGKSTFSVLLAQKLGYPCIHMDQLYWKPHWAGATDEEFITKVSQAISGECWVLDGNYSRTNEIKWQKADTIVWLDYSFARTFAQLWKRTVNRAITKEELWPGTGNRETFAKSFMSMDSIFIWFFRCYWRNRRVYGALEKSAKYKHINFVRLGSPKEANLFIQREGKTPP